MVTKKQAQPKGIDGNLSAISQNKCTYNSNDRHQDFKLILGYNNFSPSTIFDDTIESFKKNIHYPVTRGHDESLHS